MARTCVMNLPTSASEAMPLPLKSRRLQSSRSFFLLCRILWTFSFFASCCSFARRFRSLALYLRRPSPGHNGGRLSVQEGCVPWCARPAAACSCLRVPQRCAEGVATRNSCCVAAEGVYARTHLVASKCVRLVPPLPSPGSGCWHFGHSGLRCLSSQEWWHNGHSLRTTFAGPSVLAPSPIIVRMPACDAGREARGLMAAVGVAPRSL